MNIKKTGALLTAIALLSVICMPALAADYSIVFEDYPVSIINYGSPLSTYAVVTSKWNQPRSEGTNPHNGVDLRASLNTDVYAPYDGWITHISGAGGTDIEFLVDANNNRVQDDADYRIRFYHLNSREAAGFKTKGSIIGKSGEKGSPGSPHLHFGNYTGGKWYRNEPNYRHLSSTNWNSGKDLDAYSLVTWSNNTASFNSYVMNSGSSSAFTVTLFYRTTTGGSWTNAGTLSPSGYNYSYNFTGKVPSGADVQWMFRLVRSGISQAAFGKAKFYQPDNDPNSSSYAYAYWTNRVS